MLDELERTKMSCGYPVKLLMVLNNSIVCKCSINS